jgi:hypothetical protein
MLFLKTEIRTGDSSPTKQEYSTVHYYSRYESVKVIADVYRHRAVPRLLNVMKFRAFASLSLGYPIFHVSSYISGGA